jgi:hypothetical protein
LSHEKQREITYTVERKVGRHDLRTGGDYVRLLPVVNGSSATLSAASQGIDSLLAGVPLGLTTSEFILPPLNIRKYPFWAQDTMHISDRLQILFGLRWELTPAPYANNRGFIPPSFFIGNWSGTGASSPIVFGSANPQGSRWPTRYNQLLRATGSRTNSKHPAWFYGQEQVFSMIRIWPLSSQT